MEVCSAVSGKTLAFLDPEEFEGKSAKSVKQCLAAKFGITRFRKKLLEEGSDGSGIPDDAVFAQASVTVQLVILDFWPLMRSKTNNSSLHLGRTMQLHLKSCCDNHGIPT